MEPEKTASHLLPCPSCERHIRASTLVCPFCEAATGALPKTPAPVGPRTRLSRAALTAFGASALTLAIVACGGNTNTEDGGAGDDGSATDGGGDECHPVFTAYGGPPPCSK